MPSLDRDGDVFVISLGDDENRFNQPFVSELAERLTEVESSEGPKALVLSAEGKFWSNGLDLEWFAANTDGIPKLVADVHETLARLLEFPAPVIAALQGHTFAAGAMLALAVDERIMRADRGFFCLPEIDIRIPFTPGMSALIQARLAQSVAHEAMTTGRRYGGAEAEAAGIVQSAVPEDQVLPAAIARAAELAPKDGATLKVIKQRMYAPVLKLLRDPAGHGIPTG